MEDEIFDKDLASKVQRVLSENASNYENQTQDKEWNEIMEETNKEVKKQTSRTRMFAIAASILLVAVIGGTIFAVANNGDSKSIKTVDDKDKTPVTKPAQETSSTTTTIPLTPEEQLLKDTAVLKSDPNGPGGQSYGMVLLNPITSDVLSDISQKGYTSFNEPSFSAGHASFRTGDEYCEGQDELISSISLDLKTMKSTKLEDIAKRDYSPTQESYFDLIDNCNGPGDELKIINIKTNKVKTFKSVKSTNVAYEGVEGPGVAPTSELSVKNAIWVDENRILINLYENIEYDVNNYGSSTKGGWHILDISKNNSISNAVGIESYCCLPDTSRNITDIRVENGRTYILTTGSDAGLGDSSTENVKIIDLESKKVIWTKQFDTNKYGFIQYFGFGKDINEIYGSIAQVYIGDTQPEFQAIAYDNDTDTTVTPKGGILIPLFR